LNAADLQCRFLYPDDQLITNFNVMLLKSLAFEIHTSQQFNGGAPYSFRALLSAVSFGEINAALLGTILLHSNKSSLAHRFSSTPLAIYYLFLFL
jgi:hypothetical protein